MAEFFVLQQVAVVRQEGDAVIHFERAFGKRNYEDVRKILQHMKTLKNGEKLVEKIVEEYKIKYANRRLMLEELNKI